MRSCRRPPRGYGQNTDHCARYVSRKRQPTVVRVRIRISLAVVIASRTLETTCAARARSISSAALTSSSSALARMIPSWLLRRWNSRPDVCRRRLDCVHYEASFRGSSGGLARLAPERIREDAHRAAGRPHVLDLAAGDPVVDGAAADADQLAGFHDRNRLSVNHHDVVRTHVVPLPLSSIGAEPRSPVGPSGDPIDQASDGVSKYRPTRIND